MAYNFNGNNNQQSGHAGGFGGMAQDLGITSSYQANAPNQQGYQDFANNQNDYQNQFAQQADAAQGRQGPQIANQFQGQSRDQLGQVQGSFGDIQNKLQGLYNNPYDSQGQHQFQQGLDQSVDAGMAQANSARGGALAENAARRQSMQQSGIMRAQAAGQAAMLADQNQRAALGMGAQVAGQRGQLSMDQYNTEQGDAQKQAQLQIEQGGLNNQLTGEYLGASSSAAGNQLGALNGSTAGQNAAQAINANTASQAGQAGAGLFGQIMSGAGNVAGMGLSGAGGGMTPGADGMPSSALPNAAPGTEGGVGGVATGVGGQPTSYDGNGIPPLFSDPKLKKGMRMDPATVDAFLDHVDPKTFRYKKRRHEPNVSPTGGSYLGVSADDVERAPIVGKQIVTHGPEGKQLNTGAALSAALASVGQLHRRLRKVEGK